MWADRDSSLVPVSLAASGIGVDVLGYDGTEGLGTGTVWYFFICVFLYL